MAKKKSHKKGIILWNGQYLRHPLVFITEAAIEEGKLPLNRLIGLKRNLYMSERSPESDFVIFENWLEEVRLWLMHCAAYAFTQNYDAIMAGTYLDGLFVGTYAEDTLAILKSVMVKYVYDCNDVVVLELSAKRIIGSLLEDFIRAVLYYDEPDAKGNLGTIDSRFICMIPDTFKQDYWGAKNKLVAAGVDSEAELLYLRFLVVTDYISGISALCDLSNRTEIVNKPDCSTSCADGAFSLIVCYTNAKMTTRDPAYAGSLVVFMF